MYCYRNRSLSFQLMFILQLADCRSVWSASFSTTINRHMYFLLPMLRALCTSLPSFRPESLSNATAQSLPEVLKVLLRMLLSRHFETGEISTQITDFSRQQINHDLSPYCSPVSLIEFAPSCARPFSFPLQIPQFLLRLEAIYLLFYCVQN